MALASCPLSCNRSAAILPSLALEQASSYSARRSRLIETPEHAATNSNVFPIRVAHRAESSCWSKASRSLPIAYRIPPRFDNIRALNESYPDRSAIFQAFVIHSNEPDTLLE